VDTEANANTKKKTASDIALVELFLAKERETSAIEEIPPADLDRYLSKFLLSVRKRSGEEYEPTTLRGFIASVDRYKNLDTASQSLRVKVLQILEMF
jgi:hypothetical protein